MSFWDVIDDLLDGAIDVVFGSIGFLVDLVVETLDLFFDVFISIVADLLAIAEKVISIFLPGEIGKRTNDIQITEDTIRGANETLTNIVNDTLPGIKEQNKKLIDDVKSNVEKLKKLHDEAVRSKEFYENLQAKGVSHIEIPVDNRGQVIQDRVRFLGDRVHDPRVSSLHREGIKVFQH